MNLNIIQEKINYSILFHDKIFVNLFIISKRIDHIKLTKLSLNKKIISGEKMFCIARLGNPVKKYFKNSHNDSFLFIDWLAQKKNIIFKKETLF